MRRLCLIIIFLACSFILARSQDTLLLFHPTAYNVALIKKLSLGGMLDLRGYHVLGVFHSGESYNYAPDLEAFEAEPDSLFSYMELDGELYPDNIFGPNPCSKQFSSLFKKSRAALFMGGPDIPPAVFGEKVHLLTNVTDPYRHYMELSFLYHLLGGSQSAGLRPLIDQNPDYLISGICLGMQSMNVATGGSMIQDIPTEIYGLWSAEDLLALPPDHVHRNYRAMVENTCESPTSYHFHRVRLSRSSFLKKKLKFRKKENPLVLSSHHQALGKLGKGWKIAALSMDGKIIEAIEHEEYPHVFGVQFHPEKPGLFDPEISHPDSCEKRINFQEVIRETDSFLFHQLYWTYIGRILQNLTRSQ